VAVGNNARICNCAVREVTYPRYPIRSAVV